jgi:hypothetical protein
LTTLPGVGLKIVETDEPLLRLIEGPRESLSACLHLPELQTSGIYLLLGETRPIVLAVGSSEFLPTLFEHWVAHGTAWTTALLYTARLGRWSPTELSALKSSVTEALAADLSPGLEPGASLSTRESHEQAAILRKLTEFLGLKLFPATELPALAQGAETYYLNTGAVQARAERRGADFIVLAGSIGRRTPATDVSWIVPLQDALIENHTLLVNGGSFTLTADHPFGSAAQAASVFLGRKSSGFFDWKRGDGTCLGQLERFIDSADEPTAS